MAAYPILSFQIGNWQTLLTYWLACSRYNDGCFDVFYCIHIVSQELGPRIGYNAMVIHVISIEHE